MAPTLEDLPALTSPLGLVILALGGLVLVYVLERFIVSVPYPPGMPLVREPEGARRFSIRTRLAYYLDCERLFKDAYNNVNLSNPLLHACLQLSSTPRKVSLSWFPAWASERK